MHQQYLQLIRSMPAGRTRVRCQGGFTLTELLVGTAIGLTALATFFSFNRFQLYALRSQSSQIELQTAGRNLTDLLSREVRRAGMDPNCTKAFEGIAAASYDQIRIKSDLNGNGVIESAAGEDITYKLRYWPQAIERTANGRTETLTDSSIQTWGWFEYFDGAGVQIAPWDTLSSAQRAKVRRVRLRLWLWTPDVDPNSPTWLTASFSSSVDVRNRFFVMSTACP